MMSQNSQKHYLFFHLFTQVRLDFSKDAKTDWRVIQQAYVLWIKPSTLEETTKHPTGSPKKKKLMMEVLKTRFKICFQNANILVDDLDSSQLPIEVKSKASCVPSLTSLSISSVISNNRVYQLLQTPEFQTLPSELRHLIMSSAIKRGANIERIFYLYDDQRCYRNKLLSKSMFMIIIFRNVFK